jgi:hypothetical protein
MTNEIIFITLTPGQEFERKFQTANFDWFSLKLQMDPDLPGYYTIKIIPIKRTTKVPDSILELIWKIFAFQKIGQVFIL